MKKAPKKRKGYVYGTAREGVTREDAAITDTQRTEPTTQLDEKGNPTETKSGGNFGSKLGASMGWLQYANQAQTAVRATEKKDTLIDPVTGKEVTGYKDKESMLKETWAKPTHEVALDAAKEGKYGQAILATNPLLSQAYQYSKLRKGNVEYNQALENIESEKQKVAANEAKDLALAARERGETGYSTASAYRRDPSVDEKKVSTKENIFTKFGDKLNFAKGGEIVGKGTGTSDSIEAEVEEGSFVVPAKHAHMGKMIKEALLKKKTGKANLHQKDGVPVKLSDGEILFTPEEKEEIESEMGEEMLEALAPEAEENEEGKAKGGELSAAKARKILHDKEVNGKPLTDKQRRYMGWVAGGSKMATGGTVPKGTVVNGVTWDGKNWKIGSTVYSPEGGKKYTETYFKQQKSKSDKGSDWLSKKYDKMTSEQNKELANEYNSLKDKKDEVSVFRRKEIEKKLGAVAIPKKEEGFSAPAVKSGAQLSGNKPKADAYQAWVESLKFKPKTITEEELNQDVANIYNPNANAIDAVPVTKTEIDKPTAYGDPNLERYNKDLADANARTTTDKPNFWDKVKGVGNVDLGGALTSGINYGLGAYQIKEGRKGLQGERPINTIDPTFQANVDTAQANAKFGFTPEQKFMLDQQNQNLLNQEMFAAKNYAGGSGGNAFNMSRSAANNAFTRSLQNAAANTELQQSKQQFAAQLAAQKAQMSRNIFEDSLRAFEQKQQAAGNLMATGISNILDTNRFANFMRLRGQENQFNNEYGI